MVQYLFLSNTQVILAFEIISTSNLISLANRFHRYEFSVFVLNAWRMEKKKENGCRANLHKHAQVWGGGGGVMSRVIAVTTAVVSRGNRQKSIRQGSSKVGLLDIHVSIKICRYINWDLLRLLEWPIGALICNNMLWQLTSQKYQHVCKYWFMVRESAQW